MSTISGINLENEKYNITLPLLASGFTTTAGSNTSGAYLAAKWAVANVNEITTPVNGMTIAVRVPLAGNSGGVLLSIDGGTTYYPIVRNINTLVTTNYGVGSTIILTFNSTQTAKPYLTAGTTTTVTGCWQVADYDSDTKVTQTVRTTNGEFPILLRGTSAGTSTTTTTTTFGTGVTVNPSTKTVTATKFIGALEGNASSSDKLNTNKGSATQPIYFSGGVPVATTYSLGASVPSGAKFTDTDTKVTAVGNHYTPAADTSAALSADASSTTSATWGSTDLVTGVNIQRDAKGHVTGLTVDSIQMPANPNTDTNTTYTIATGDNNGQIKVTPSGSSAYNVSVKGLGTAAYTASTAYATAAQGTLASNALPKSGGTMTGNITMDNSASAQSGEPYIQWATVGSNKPYTGFAHDQSDGTFIICSMEKDTTTNGVKYYKNGLAIGGGSGNLFWKGERIATASEIPDVSGLAPKASPVFTTSISLGRKSGTTVGSNSIASGVDTTASGYSSQAVGSYTTASGQNSHAEGSSTTASGINSHAEGNGTVASGTNSHAEGNQTIASSNMQHVQGQFNIEDAESIYAHIVGNGSVSGRSNAHTLDWDGNAWFKGDVYVGGTNQTTGSSKLVKSSDLSSYAPKASPTFTGTPKAPTAAAGTNTTQIATTAFVQNAVSSIDGVFIGTYNSTTFAEFNAAYKAGKALFVVHSSINRVYVMISATPDSYYGFVSWDGDTCSTMGISTTGWTLEQQGHAIQHSMYGNDPITPTDIGAAPEYTYSTTDLTAGTSTLETGKLYFVYE